MSSDECKVHLVIAKELKDMTMDISKKYNRSYVEVLNIIEDEIKFIKTSYEYDGKIFQFEGKTLGV